MWTSLSPHAAVGQATSKGKDFFNLLFSSCFNGKDMTGEISVT
jgi:hypothetical protein